MSYKAELKKRYLDYIPLIREFLLAELKEQSILKYDFYQRLQDYNFDFGIAMASIDLNADRFKNEWTDSCRKARDAIFEGIEEVVMDKRVYFELAKTERLNESLSNEDKKES